MKGHQTKEVCNTDIGPVIRITTLPFDSEGFWEGTDVQYDFSHLPERVGVIAKFSGLSPREITRKRIARFDGMTIEQMQAAMTVRELLYA